MELYRILVIGDSWHGSDCTGLARGFRELGHAVGLVGTDQFIPKLDRSLSARLIRRIFTPYFQKKFNNHILQQLSILQPHFVVVFKGKFVHPETLRAMKNSDTWLCNFFPDISFFAHSTVHIDTWPEYDHIFTTKRHGSDEMKERLRLENVSCLQHGFDQLIHRPMDTNLFPPSFSCDVSFIGGWSPSKEHYLHTLASNESDLSLKIWGDRWGSCQSSDLQRSIQWQPVFGDSYALAIGASLINLGLLQDQQGYAARGDQITSRTFHIPASGGFLLHERTEEVLEYFEEGKEFACFGSGDELVEKVRYYLQNPSERKKIAMAGRDRCYREHKVSTRAQTIVEKFESRRHTPQDDN